MRIPRNNKLLKQCSGVLDGLQALGFEAYLVGTTARAILAGKEALSAVEVAAAFSPQELEDAALRAGLQDIKKRPWEVSGTCAGLQVRMVPFSSGKERHLWSSEEKPLPGKSISEHLRSHHLRLEGVGIAANGLVLDEMNGQADIERKTVSTAEDPEKVFAEYPSSMLRAAGLISELGFDPAANLLTAAMHQSHNITAVPPDVWRDELERMLLGDYPGLGLDFLIETRLCNFVLPELTNLVGFEATIEYHHKDLWEHSKLAVTKGRKDAAIRWALLLHDLGKVYTRTVEAGEIKFLKHEQVSRLLAGGILYRLRFPREMRSRVLFLISNHMKPAQYGEEWTDSAVRRFMRTSGEMLEDLIEISSADISSKNPRKVKRNIRSLEALAERVKRIQDEEAGKIVLPKGLGNAIMQEFGLDPSPEVGELISDVKRAIEEGELGRDGSVEEYLAYLVRLHGARPAGRKAKRAGT